MTYRLVFNKLKNRLAEKYVKFDAQIEWETLMKVCFWLWSPRSLKYMVKISTHPSHSSLLMYMFTLLSAFLCNSVHDKERKLATLPMCMFTIHTRNSPLYNYYNILYKSLYNHCSFLHWRMLWDGKCYKLSNENLHSK